MGDSGWGWGTSTADGSGWGGSSTDSSSWSWGAAEQVSHSFSGSTEPDYNIECELFNSSNVQAVGINFDKYDAIPVEVSDGCPLPITSFSAESMGKQLFKNLILCKYSKPTPVQKYSIPIGLSGGDMMACAQTGSGKTAGFLFPIISSLLSTGPLLLPVGVTRKAYCCYPSAVVLAPTRELACQIYAEARKFCYCTGIHPLVVYGGVNIFQQMTELEKGCDLIIATPGRLLDLINRKKISLSIVKFLVLDEADRMLDMGFEPQIRTIVEDQGMPTGRQTFMFSATFPWNIQQMAKDFLKQYIYLTIGRVGAACGDVTQKVEWVEEWDKDKTLLTLLHKLSTSALILIFVNTKRAAARIENALIKAGHKACSIHGDKEQLEREEALRAFKSGRLPVLVATDVAARGLDVPNVAQVINFDLPSNIEDYVHRIGRTGRVGNVGYALSFINDKNRCVAKQLRSLLVENQQECPPLLTHLCGAAESEQCSSSASGNIFQVPNRSEHSTFSSSGGASASGTWKRDLDSTYASSSSSDQSNHIRPSGRKSNQQRCGKSGTTGKAAPPTVDLTGDNVVDLR